MRSDYLPHGELVHILAALTEPNRLACETSLCTGLRISDVLNMRSKDLKQRMTIEELKTGKRRRVYMPAELLKRIESQSGDIYAFEGRGGRKTHRTRQAVYKDIKRAASLFRLQGGKKLQISPHSLRKTFSVDAYHKYGGDMRRVQALLNHSNEAVTMLYALADQLTDRKLGGLQKNDGKTKSGSKNG